jgi:hypothetical protein
MRHMTVQRLILKELRHMTMYIYLCRGRKERSHSFYCRRVSVMSTWHMTLSYIGLRSADYAGVETSTCRVVSVDRTTLVTHRKAVAVGYCTGYTVRKTGNLMLLLIIHETNDLANKFSFITSKSYVSADTYGANGHTRSQTPVLIRSPQLSNRGRA